MGHPIKSEITTEVDENCVPEGKSMYQIFSFLFLILILLLSAGRISQKLRGRHIVRPGSGPLLGTLEYYCGSKNWGGNRPPAPLALPALSFISHGQHCWSKWYL